MNTTNSLNRVLLASALLGLIYMAFGLLGGKLPGGEPQSEPVRIYALQGVSDISDICAIETPDRVLVENNRIATRYGSTPDLFEIVFEADRSNDDLVLDMGISVDRAKLIICDGKGAVARIMTAGDMLPFEERALKTSEIAFPIGANEASQRIFLEIVQEARIFYRFNAARADVFMQASASRLNLQLLMLGSILIMVLYNFLLGALTGHLAFVFNALLVASAAVLDLYLTGIGAAFVWPAFPQFSNLTLAVGLAGPTLFGPFYVYHFLHDTKEKQPPRFWSDWRFAVWPVLSAGSLAAMAIFPQYVVFLLLSAFWILMAVYFLVLLGQQVRNGNDRAKILLVPLVGAGIPATVLGIIREFVGYDMGLPGNYLTEIALLMEALLFTLALAYLFRVSEQNEILALEKVQEISRTTNRRLLTAIDEERERIAADLHDTSGQGVVLIANRLKQLQSKPNSELVSSIGEVEAITRDVLKEIREVSHELHPPALDHLGLKQSLRELIAKTAKANDLEIRFKFGDDVTGLSANQELQIYRIVQELLINVVKHAKAASAGVSLERDSGNYRLRVTDDGIGFDGDKSSGETGIGTHVLRQRVDVLGGNMAVTSGPEGSEIEVTFAAAKAKG